MMKKVLTTGIILAAAAVCIAGTARAGSCTGLCGAINNTGVDVGANDVDAAWSIVGGSSSPSLTYPSPAYTDATNGTFPIGPWIPNSTTSSWDTPTNPLTQNLDPSVNGAYNYHTTFSTSGVDKLSGQFASDNEVIAIFINGLQIYTGPTDGSSQFSGWTTFSGLTGSGKDQTITFDVVNYAQNGGNPSGLNVEFTALTATPLPSTWTMLIAGFVGLGFFAYRGSKKNVSLAAA